MKTSLQIRCDEDLRNGLRSAARKDGLRVAEAARRAIRGYIDRPAPSMESEAIWTALAALAAFALCPAALDGFIASLKAHNALKQMASRPASEGIATVVKTLESVRLERNQDA
jgi:hypothetical protein